MFTDPEPSILLVEVQHDSRLIPPTVLIVGQVSDA